MRVALIGFVDRLLCGLVCALLWCEVAARVGVLNPVERRALQQLFNATGGTQRAWLNDTGWRDGASDPCDGHSWFGIYDWHGYSGDGLNVSACTKEPDAAGWLSLQVLSLGAVANITAAGGLGNGMRGNFGAWSMLRELSALHVVSLPGNPGLTGSIPALDGLTAL